MITLQFVGVLAEKFGTQYTLDVTSPREAVCALCSMLDGFRNYVRHHDFNLWVDDRNIGESEVGYNYGDCVVKMGLHITGAGGNSGIWMVIAGIAIIAFTWWTGGGAVTGAQLVAYGLGAGLAATGAAMLLMPTAKAETMDDEENRASYGFNKPVTTVAQGNNVPVLYGKGLIGGFVIMYRITTDDITDI